jgi:hypothetical protein
MEMDTAFGKKMAGKALGNRGILGRLKQKVFAGGQSNNVISVAFQFADPNDGWTLVDEEGNPVEGEEGKGEGGEGGDGSGGEGAAGSGGGKGGGSVASGSGGSSGGSGGKGTGHGGALGSGGGSSAGNLEGGKDIKSLMSLLQRVERLEDNVGVGPGSKGKNKEDEKDTNGKDTGGNDKYKDKNKDKYKDTDKPNKDKEKTYESSDPFYGIDQERVCLIEEICRGDGSIEELVDNVIG